MSGEQLFWLSVLGIIATTFASSGAKALSDFSLHELETYCRRRRSLKRLDEILSRHHRLSLAAETLHILSLVLAVVCGGVYLTATGVLSSETSVVRWATIVVCSGFLLLAASTWIPWTITRWWSAPFLFHTWRIWKSVAWVLFPLTVGASFVDILSRRLAGKQVDIEDEEEAFEEEIRTIVTAGLRDGLLEEDTREMIEGVIELGDADVADIMTPRSKVDSMQFDLPWEEVLRYVIEVGRTRIPVYRKNLDDIVGILYVKDLLPEFSKKNDPQQTRLKEMLRQPWFVPTTKAVDDLLQEFLQTRNHLAIVVDEYNSVAGVVTIEDVLEEIVGEIIDEYDKEIEEEIVTIDETSYEVQGQVHLDELNERLGLEFPVDEDYDTIGGFVINQLGRIPKEGDSLTWNRLQITVLSANRRLIERIRIETLDDHRREMA